MVMTGQLYRQSSAAFWDPVGSWGWGWYKSGKSGISHGKGEGHVVHAGINL